LADISTFGVSLNQYQNLQASYGSNICLHRHHLHHNLD
jgi:hypothetical protein